MEYPAGWLWVLIGIGVIVLGAVIVWNIQVQRQRRLSAPEKREQNEVIKENYQKGG
jgi:cytochrome c-type biogenesis protein CcmH/NrfF